jgi:hypothetical protein
MMLEKSENESEGKRVNPIKYKLYNNKCLVSIFFKDLEKTKVCKNKI